MSTSVSHAGGSGAGRKARTPQQQVASHYKSLRDQLEGNFFDNALKTCDRSTFPRRTAPLVCVS